MVSPISGPVDEAPLPLGFTEFKASGRESYDWREGKAELIRVFDGPWDNRIAFIFEHVMPQVNSAGGQTIYSSPNVYPAYPSARAYKADVEGKLSVGKDEFTGMIKHAMARITVTYSTPNFVDDSQNNNRPPGSRDPLYVIETVDTETEILPIPARKVEVCYHGGHDDIPCEPFEPGDAGVQTEAEYLAIVGDRVRKKITELGKVPVRINRFNYKLKLPYVIYPRWIEIDFCLGKLNYIPIIMPSGLFAPPGTLRYDGLASVTKRELSVGALVWEMEHKFCYYRPGWNTVPDIGDDGKLRNVTISPKLYEDAVHQLIFIPVSNSAIRAARLWWQNISIATKRKLYNPKRDNKLSHTQIINLLDDSDWNGSTFNGQWVPWHVPIDYEEELIFDEPFTIEGN